MNQIIACVRSNAQWWACYKLWLHGNPQMRGFQMARAMRDIVMLGVLYRAERNQVNHG